MFVTEPIIIVVTPFRTCQVIVNHIYNVCLSHLHVAAKEHGCSFRVRESEDLGTCHGISWRKANGPSKLPNVRTITVLSSHWQYEKRFHRILIFILD